jgi:hypothetical protein
MFFFSLLFVFRIFLPKSLKIFSPRFVQIWVPVFVISPLAEYALITQKNIFFFVQILGLEQNPATVDTFFSIATFFVLVFLENTFGL